MPRLLVVEDERKLLRSLVRGLEAEGYEVVGIVDGREVETILAQQSFDCLVLDWMIPGKDGMQILSDVRKAGSGLPLMMLTARDSIEDRVRGLDLGADDYLVKPFAFAELLARIRSLLRRGQPERETMLHCDDLEVDLVERRVRLAGTNIDLRPREFDVLTYLLRHQGETVTREMLGRDVWNEPHHHLTNVIEVTITLLRKKLGTPSMIQTVRGVGYCLRSE